MQVSGVWLDLDKSSSVFAGTILSHHLKMRVKSKEILCLVTSEVLAAR